MQGEGAWEPRAAAPSKKRTASGNTAARSDSRNTASQLRQRAGSPDEEHTHNQDLDANPDDQDQDHASSDDSGVVYLESGGNASTRDVSPARSQPHAGGKGTGTGSPSRSVGGPRLHQQADLSDEEGHLSTASTAGTGMTPLGENGVGDQAEAAAGAHVQLVVCGLPQHAPIR